MNVSKTFVFFVISAAVCAVVRYLQLVFSVDFETGFYYNHAGFLGNLYYILLAAGFAGLTVFSFIDKKEKKQFFIKRFCETDETDVLIVSFMFLIPGAVLIIDFFTSPERSVPGILSGIVGAAGFLSIGLLLYFKKRIAAVSGFLMLLPAVYYTARAVTVFMEHLVITRMSEYLAVLLVDILLVFFFLGLGRAFSENEGRLTRIRASICGFSAVAVIFSELSAKTVYWLTSSGAMREYLTAEGTKFIMPDMKAAAEGIVVITLLIVLMKNPYRKNDEEDDV